MDGQDRRRIMLLIGQGRRVDWKGMDGGLIGWRERKVASGSGSSDPGLGGNHRGTPIGAFRIVGPHPIIL